MDAPGNLIESEYQPYSRPVVLYMQYKTQFFVMLIASDCPRFVVGETLSLVVNSAISNIFIHNGSYFFLTYLSTLSCNLHSCSFMFSLEHIITPPNCCSAGSRQGLVEILWVSYDSVV